MHQTVTRISLKAKAFPREKLVKKKQSMKGDEIRKVDNSKSKGIKEKGSNLLNTQRSFKLSRDKP